LANDLCGADLGAANVLLTSIEPLLAVTTSVTICEPNNYGALTVKLMCSINK